MDHVPPVQLTLMASYLGYRRRLESGQERAHVAEGREADTRLRATEADLWAAQLAT